VDQVTGSGSGSYKCDRCLKRNQVSLTASDVSDRMIDGNDWASNKEQQIVQQIVQKKISQKNQIPKEDFDYSGIENKKYNMMKKNEMLNRAKKQQMNGVAGEQNDGMFGEAGEEYYADLVVDGFQDLAVDQKKKKKYDAQNSFQTAPPKMKASSVQKCDKCRKKHVFECFSVS
jgi:hypothetical protein